MRHTFLAVAVAFALCSAANAAQRTFVSAGNGNDANPCSRLQPCRNFAAAIAAADAGGEVVVLDSGGYGALTIAKSISLISPSGVYAGITGFTGQAIDIAAGSSDIVVLRGLSLNGLGATIGVAFTSGGTLQVDDSVLSSFPDRGISLEQSNGNFTLMIRGTTIRNGATLALSYGVYVENSGAGQMHASVDHSTVERYGICVLAANNVNVTVRNSTLQSSAGWDVAVAANTGLEANAVVDHSGLLHGGIGVTAGDSSASPFTGGTATITVSNSLIADCSAGVSAQNHGTAILSYTTLANNSTGVTKSGTGVLISSGSNQFLHNTTDGTFSSTIVQK